MAAPCGSAGLAAAYRRFAEEEARGRSPLYEALARGVADDADLLAFLGTLPPPKRQPNLFFACARLLFGTAPDFAGFRRAVLAEPDRLRAAMLVRATQTNEPARCATLLPVLALLPQPLALIEVGASAGLCLLPDFYAYEYGARALRPEGVAEPPLFRCVAEGAPIPGALPRIAWRAGLDLNPIDVADAAQAAWLETLVWPEQTERLARLRAALRIAGAQKPRVIRGDLRTDLPRLAAEAPGEATLVVFHTAVLSYLDDPADRESFAGAVQAHCRFWIANESPRVLPGIAAAAGAAPPGRFLLSVNGHPAAWTDPHGASLRWIPGASPGHWAEPAAA